MEKMIGARLIEMLDTMVGNRYVLHLGEMIYIEGVLQKEQNISIDTIWGKYSIADTERYITPMIFTVEVNQEYEVKISDDTDCPFVHINNCR